MIGPSEIVGFGEIIHGSPGIYEAKFEIIRYLIEEMGFRTLAMEFTWPRTSAINDYVLNGEGSAELALNNIAWSNFRDPAFLRMFRWMREFNERNPDDQLRIFGFDTGDDQGYMELLLRSIQELKSIQLKDSLIEALEPVLFQVDSPSFGSGEERQSIDRVDEILDKEIDKAALSNGTPSKELIFARMAARNIRHAQVKDLAPQESTRERHRFRDLLMFQNFEELWATEAPGTKVIIFAHNAHIQRGHEEAEFLTGTHDHSSGVKSMGSYLSQKHRKNYFALGHLGLRIGINKTQDSWIKYWANQGGDVFPPSPPDALESLLAKASRNDLILDTRNAFSRQPPVFTVSQYHDGLVRQNIARQYDAIWFQHEAKGPIEGRRVLRGENAKEGTSAEK
jgi:erythromycin esterase